MAVQLDRGLALVLLDLSLIAAGIPQLALPSGCPGADAAAAMARCGAQAGYLNATSMIQLRNTIPMMPLPEGTGRIAVRPRGPGNFKQFRVPLRYITEIAGALVESAEQSHFARHLALQPTWMLSEAIGGFYATILAGGTYVMPPPKVIGLANDERPDFGRLAESIAAMRITSLVVGPTLLAGLVSALETRACRLPILARVIVSGGPMPHALFERSRALDLPVRMIHDLARSTWLAAFEELPEMAEGRASSS